MIFEKLTIHNFRQFYGKQDIFFAKDIKHKNITVLHGFNGSGKTTFLNVLTWLFYKEFSPDFENYDYLETEGAFAKLKAGDYMVTSAKLIFRDKGREYTTERRRVIYKDDRGKRCIVKDGELTLNYISKTGEFRDAGNPQDSLEQLLPKPLYPFFFFNGERIEKLASNNAYEEIESGIKILLDIEVFDRAINHIDNKVIKQIRDKIAEHSGEDGKKAKRELQEIENEQLRLEAEIERETKNLKSLQQEKEAIDAKLRQMPNLAAWQKEREEKEKAVEDKRRELQDRRRLLAEQVSKNGYLVLVNDVLSKAKNILEAARQEGELPIPMKRQFVSDLLKQGQCICGRKLLQGQLPYSSVEQWRDRVGSEELDAAVSVTSANLKSLVQRREEFLKEIKNLQNQRSEIYDNIRRLEEEISELSSKIGNREGGENYALLEERRQEIDTNITEIKITISKTEDRLKDLDNKKREKEREIKKFDKVDEQGKLAQRRMDALSTVRSALEQIRQVRHEQLSKDLSKRLSEVWSGIAIKDYQAKLDERYHLRLTKMVDGIEEPVRGASTGEKQVLSLAFIGSLVDKARSTYYEREKPGQKILFKGGLYPLVIDSAFGQLEPEYKKDVAAWIPTLAPQVIILVSESQWKQEVEQALQNRIGYQWILQCSTSKQRSKNITLNGREYPYVVESKEGFEQTKIMKVER
jgi:DNA sulfur modification protein DndD